MFLRIYREGRTICLLYLRHIDCTAFSSTNRHIFILSTVRNESRLRCIQVVDCIYLRLFWQRKKWKKCGRKEDSIVHINTTGRIKNLFSCLPHCFLRRNYHTAYSWCLWLDFELGYVFISWGEDRRIACAIASATSPVCLSPYSKGHELSAVGISCLLSEFSSRSDLFSVGFTTARFSYHRVFLFPFPRRGSKDT